ncbi:MAG: molybdopterin-synthase adenylyltransferase MoeB [Candidatus Hydrogenedentes bacterium]|nr:molybdopterin-synthase adenylyltransferase MoeB [Candidatus Hydrogenedentota bacterium]
MRALGNEYIDVLEEPDITLTPQEIARYSRHLIMPEVAMDGQKRLKAAKVLLIGAGGLGSPLGLYLAAAGVGKIGIVDFDVVDYSNLQRQVMHTTKDVGRKKIESAAEHLRAINTDIEIETYEARITSENALNLIEPYDIVIDGTDNFPTRYLTNDACVLLGKPNIYGSIYRFEGQASVFATKGGPCYRCLFAEPPPPGAVPSCAEGGVLGILPGVIGCIQATEAIKLIIGKGKPLIGRLLLYDALEMKFREVKIKRNPECPMCGDNPTIKALIDYEQFCGVRGEEAAAVNNNACFDTTVEEVKARLERGDDFDILDVRNPEEWMICHIEGAKLIPLGELPMRIHELDMSREIVVHCKGGVRSAKAAGILREAGFTKVKNVQGGILEWARAIDPTMPTY